MYTDRTPEPFAGPFSGENADDAPLEEGEETLSGAMEGIDAPESAALEDLSEERVRAIEEEDEEVLSGAMADFNPPEAALEEEEEIVSGAMAEFGAPPVAQEEPEETLSATAAFPEHPGAQPQFTSAETTPAFEDFEMAQRLGDAQAAAEEEVRIAAENGEEISLDEGVARAKERNKKRLDAVLEIDNKATEQERREERDRFEASFDDDVREQLGINEKGMLLPQLQKKALESEENRKTIRDALVRNGYSEKRADAIVENLVSERYADDIATLRSLDFLTRVAEEDEELFREMMEAEDIDAFVRERADEVELFREYVEEQQEIEKLRHAIGREAMEPGQEQPRLDPDTTAQLIETGVDPGTLAALPPEGQVAVANLVRKGGPVVVGALLANGVSLNDETFIGTVSGQNVVLNFVRGNLGLTGEQAADRANQTVYPVDPPTVENFVTVLVHSIGEQNDLSYIANNPQQARALFAPFLGAPNSESLPREESIDEARSFYLLLVGGQGFSEGEERSFLRRIGILNPSGGVDDSRVMLYRDAVRMYMRNDLALRRGTEDDFGVGEESPGLDHEDVITLAALWDKDEGRLPESLSELKKLTKIRLEGGNIHEVRYI